MDYRRIITKGYYDILGSQDKLGIITKGYYGTQLTLEEELIWITLNSYERISSDIFATDAINVFLLTDPLISPIISNKDTFDTIIDTYIYVDTKLEVRPQDLEEV